MTNQHDELIPTLLELFYLEYKRSLLGVYCFKYKRILLGASFFENKYILLGVFLLADKSSVLGVLYLKTEVVDLQCRHSNSSHVERLRLNPKVPQVRVNLQIFELYGYTGPKFIYSIH
jgi:hypothetical protein